ncbi:MAG: hypothetical protein CMI94_01765 [Pelagibacteraceae bacterium]|nr:hypothetical protein [Pelagibacteraceae bacterium]
MKKNNKFLSGNFLISSPTMADPRFYKSVIYLITHKKEGAMGIVINQPIIKANINNLINFEEIKNNSNIDNIPITYGGPVDTKKGFILHTPEFKDESTIKVDNEVFLTSNINILKSIVKGDGPKKSLFALGYAGWFAGQLENELNDNGWLVAPGDSKLIFECKAEKKWREAIKSIGINPDFLNSNSGKC